MTEISEHVKIKSGTVEEDGTNFDAFFPQFVWAIRDFTLELELDGRAITADEYLEHALTPQRGSLFLFLCCLSALWYMKDLSAILHIYHQNVDLD